MKIYKTRYTLNGTGQISILGAGNWAVIRCRAVSHEGRMTRIAVRQAGGANVAFTVEVVDSLLDLNLSGVKFGAANGTAASNTSAGGNVAELKTTETAVPTGTILDMARVRATSGNITAGSSFVDVENPEGFAFANQEGKFSTAAREFYVLLIPTGNGANTTWELSATTVVDIG